MGRRERPVDPSSGPLPAFAHELRELRKAAGSPSYRALAKVAHFSDTSLSVAAGGTTLPSLEVTLAYVRACGGDVGEWTRRWSSTASVLGLAPDRAGPVPQPAPSQLRPAQLQVKGDLTEDEARDLLASRLGRDRIAADPIATFELIELCTRLPLALGIAAARAAIRASLPLAETAAELRDAGRRLDALDVGDAATSVRAVFSWSLAGR